MSNLAQASEFVQTLPQLPISWYFDRKIADIEQWRLFDRGPQYIGHELLVPNKGDYHVLDWQGNARALVRAGEDVKLVSNICRHRQAILLQGRGNTRNIACPLHRWTYALDGKLLGAPHFPTNPCLDLESTPLTNWNGMLFTRTRDILTDLGTLGIVDDIDFSGYMFDRVETVNYPFNWKTFIEVYLEDYHVVPFHPGLSNFVTCKDLTWDFNDWYCVQTVGVNNNFSRAGTPIYAKWQEQVLKYCNGQAPKYGAIWMVYYPNIMIEWYPHVLVISTVLPRGPEACTNVVEFYYPEDIVRFEREFIEAEKLAYQETAVEDEIICNRMTEGRRALYLEGRNEVGPYQSPMEDGLQHFHEFVRREISSSIASQA
jgi:choline monooxygenase